MPWLVTKLEDQLRAIALQETASTTQESPSRDMEELAVLSKQLETISKNMALAATPDQYEAVATVFNQLKQKQQLIERNLRDCSPPITASNIEAEVNRALELFKRIPELANDTHISTASEVIELANARLFLRFQSVQVKKRRLNRIAGGVLVLGSSPPPITIYHGPTGRRGLKANNGAAVAPSTAAQNLLPYGDVAGEEGKSSRNVNRGDRI